MSGPRLYGVGVGPGAPDLLTLRAASVLRRVAVVAAPRRSEAGASLAGRIAAEAVVAPEGQERLPLTFPMTRDPGSRRDAREAAARAIAERLRRGLEVAFVTEGDPLLYSSFLDVLAEAPRHFPGVPIEIVPGITSVTATAAAARVPLADGTDRLAILPAAEALEDVARLAREFDALVLMKAGPVLPALVEALDAAGLLPRALLVADASTPRERVVRDLRALGGAPAGYFATVLVVREHAREAR